MNIHYNFIKTYLTNTTRPTFTDLSAAYEPEIATRSTSMAFETSTDLQNTWILLYNSVAAAQRPKSVEEPSVKRSSILFKRVFTQVTAGKLDFQNLPESSTSHLVEDTKEDGALAKLLPQDPELKDVSTLRSSSILCKRASAVLKQQDISDGHSVERLQLYLSSTLHPLHTHNCPEPIPSPVLQVIEDTRDALQLKGVTTLDELLGQIHQSPAAGNSDKMVTLMCSSKRKYAVMETCGEETGKAPRLQ